MEDDSRLARECTSIQTESPQSDSKVKEVLPTTEEKSGPSFEDCQSAGDESPMVTNSQQTHQGSIESTVPSESKFQQDTVRDCGSPASGPDQSDSGSNSSSGIGAVVRTPLWCPETKWSHGELVAWGVSRCPACKYKVKDPEPQQAAGPHETKGIDTAASAHIPSSTDPKARRQAQCKYSNKFLWSNGEHIFSEPWPELLDLDRDRGKLALTQEPSDGPVIEIVTVVATNLASNSRCELKTNWIMSNTSVGTECVRKDVIIHSRRVMDALQTLVPYYPDVDLGGESVNISQPYALFYHYFEEVKEFQNTYHRLREERSGNPHLILASERGHLKICDEETYEHLEIVREVIERENLVEVQEEIDRHHQSPPIATYSMLWVLFKPGTKIYVRRSGLPVHAGVVLAIQGGGLSPGKSEPFSIDYWTLDFDGTRLGRYPLDFVIKTFAGERRISDLEVSPCSYYDAGDCGVLRETLISRGQKFWRFLPGFQVDYVGRLPKDKCEWVGLSLVEHYRRPFYHCTEPRNSQQGRVIIDPMTYYRYAYSEQEQSPVCRNPKLLPFFVGNIQDSAELQHRNMRSSPPPRRMGRQMDHFNMPPGPSQRWQHAGPPGNESGPWAEYDNIIPGPDTRKLELIDHVTGETDLSRYLLCPPMVLGFDLKARQWGK